MRQRAPAFDALKYTQKLHSVGFTPEQVLGQTEMSPLSLKKNMESLHRATKLLRRDINIWIGSFAVVMTVTILGTAVTVLRHVTCHENNICEQH